MENELKVLHCMKAVMDRYYDGSKVAEYLPGERDGFEVGQRVAIYNPELFEKEKTPYSRIVTAEIAEVKHVPRQMMVVEPGKLDKKERGPRKRLLRAISATASELDGFLSERAKPAEMDTILMFDPETLEDTEAILMERGPRKTTLDAVKAHYDALSSRAGYHATGQNWQGRNLGGQRGGWSVGGGR